MKKLISILCLSTLLVIGISTTTQAVSHEDPPQPFSHEDPPRP